MNFYLKLYLRVINWFLSSCKLNLKLLVLFSWLLCSLLDLSKEVDPVVKVGLIWMNLISQSWSNSTMSLLHQQYLVMLCRSTSIWRIFCFYAGFYLIWQFGRELWPNTTAQKNQSSSKTKCSFLYVCRWRDRSIYEEL